jgi:hypothetical protein
MKDILASLVYDSWTESIPELRSTALPGRHLIFEGNGLILDLLLKKEDGVAFIHVGGQILPGNDPLNTVSDVPVLIEHGASRKHTHTNALGEFAFHAVPNGSFDLTITLSDRRFMVRGLSNDEPRAWRVVASAAAHG